MSKGHVCPVFLPYLVVRDFVTMEKLDKSRSVASVQQGYPDMKRISGVSTFTGALGQGISFIMGMAKRSTTKSTSRQ